MDIETMRLQEEANLIFIFRDWYLPRYNYTHFIDDKRTNRVFRKKWMMYGQYLKERDLRDTEELREWWFDNNFFI